MSIILKFKPRWRNRNAEWPTIRNARWSEAGHCSQSTERVRWVVVSQHYQFVYLCQVPYWAQLALIDPLSSERVVPSRPHSARNTVAPTSTHTTGSIAGDNRWRNVTHIRWVRCSVAPRDSWNAHHFLRQVRGGCCTDVIRRMW